MLVYNAIVFKHQIANELFISRKENVAKQRKQDEKLGTVDGLVIEEREEVGEGG